MNETQPSPFLIDPELREDSAGIAVPEIGLSDGGFLLQQQMENGWIKLDRGIVKHWLFADANHLKIWVYLLASANYAPSRALVGGELVTVERGDVLASLSRIATDCGVSVKVVRTFLAHAEKDEMISTKNRTKWGTRGAHLSICKYNDYQGQRAHDGHSRGTVGAHQGQHHKKGRKKEETILGSIVSAPTEKARPESIEQVREYMASIGMPDRAEQWMAHYESNGWKVGRNAMKDWKAAVRTWKTNHVASPEPTEHMPPPTWEEAVAYGRDTKGINGQVVKEWYLFRNSRGWTNIANWKADLALWEERDKLKGAS